jgi:hypothetical protein
MTSRSELTYDRIEVGACYADREVTISSALIAAYRGAIESDDERCRPNGAGEDDQVAPPSLPVIWTPPRVSFSSWTVPPGGIHTAQRWENRRALCAGEVLRERIFASEKYARDGKNYVVFEAKFEDRAGELVARGSMSLIWPK